jgi:hypothetical protein
MKGLLTLGDSYSKNMYYVTEQEALSIMNILEEAAVVWKDTNLYHFRPAVMSFSTLGGARVIEPINIIPTEIEDNMI